MGSLVEENSKRDEEIKTRIGIVKANFGKMRGIMINIYSDMHLKLRILKSYVCLRLLFGSESLPIKSDTKKKLVAVELWFQRRMLRVPRLLRRTNPAVLEMAGSSRQLMTTIRRRWY